MEIGYQDSLGQTLVPEGEAMRGCFGHEGYVSPHITLDKKDPETVSLKTETVPLKLEGDIPFFRESPTYELILAEENFHPGNFRWKKDEQKIIMSDWTAYYEDGIRKNRVTFQVRALKKLCRDRCPR